MATLLQDERRAAPLAGALLIMAAMSAAPVGAQVSPYTGEVGREIKALSQSQVDELLAGAGMGFALAAELNGLPGPRHVLDMASELHLDDAQRAAVDAVFRAMQSRAITLGTCIVARERELDALFASGAAAANDVEAMSVELGRLSGELRGVHLRAHVETTSLLSEHQVARYAELRGYAGADHSGAGGHEHR
jgi:hypothetical protein